MKLYFRNSYGEERLIAEPTTPQECRMEVNKFLNEHNFKSYYTRIHEEPDKRLCMDVGSWSEFFFVEGITMEEFNSDLVQNQSKN